MLVVVTRTMASVGCSTFGSSTCSTLTSRLPFQTTAFTSSTPHWILSRIPGLGPANRHPKFRQTATTLCCARRIGNDIDALNIHDLGAMHMTSARDIMTKGSEFLKEDATVAE